MLRRHSASRPWQVRFDGLPHPRESGETRSMQVRDFTIPDAEPPYREARMSLAV